MRVHCAPPLFDLLLDFVVNRAKTPMAELRLAWAVSGGGSTLQAVIRAKKLGLLSSRVVFVATDRELPIRAICFEERIAFRSIIPRANAPWSTIECQLRAALLENRVDWLFLTFNRLISRNTIEVVNGQVVNLHMSLLPAFPGFGATRKALAERVTYAGVTAHMVDEGVDTGPILMQASCPVLTEDTEATLGRRQFEVGLPVILELLRSIECNELYLDSSRRPIWRRPCKSISEDLIRFSREFCDTYPPPKAYATG